jgi:hypothetical protein
MASDVRPYLVPAPATVSWDPWSLWDGEDRTTLPDAIDGWDSGTDLRIRRIVRVDVERFLAETGLDISERVALTVSWTSSASGMTESASPISLARSGVTVAEALLPGVRIGGTVRLRSTLCLTSSMLQRSAGVAWIPGSVFDEHKRRLALEGTLSMFPVHDLDFSRTRLSADASWHLETTTDLTAPFLGTFRLLLNNRDRELMAAVSRGAKDKRQQAIIEDLQQGVAMQLLELAVLLREDLSLRDAWPPETVGDVLARVLASSAGSVDIFGPTGPHDFAEFRTRLAGAVRASGHGRPFQ